MRLGLKETAPRIAELGSARVRQLDCPVIRMRIDAPEMRVERAGCPARTVYDPECCKEARVVPHPTCQVVVSPRACGQLTASCADGAVRAPSPAGG